MDHLENYNPWVHKTNNDITAVVTSINKDSGHVFFIRRDERSGNESTDGMGRDEFLRSYESCSVNPPPYARFDAAVGNGKTVSCDFFSFDDDMVAQTFGAINNESMRLIGIAGKAGAGKDTLASYLLDNLGGDWTRSSFADPIKKMLEAIGVDCSDEAKDLPKNQYGVSTRHMMQTLGTEWGRNLINGDIWVKAFAHSNAGKCVVVPDVRFANEADLIRDHGVLIHLVGRGGIEGNHVSENPIEFKPGDIVIDNSRDLAWLYSQVDNNVSLSEFISKVSL